MIQYLVAGIHEAVRQTSLKGLVTAARMYNADGCTGTTISISRGSTVRSLAYNTCILIIAAAAVLISFGCAKPPMPAETAPPQPGTAADAEAQRIIVAQVNNKDITMDALIMMMNTLPGKNDKTPETFEERKTRALESLVLLELAYQRATALGLTVDPRKVDIALDNLRQNIGGEKEFAEFLAGQHKTEAELRSEIERSLTINLIYTRDVVDMVVVPEDELRKEYEKEKQQLLQPEKMSVIDVYLLRTDGTAARKRAEELLVKIKADPRQDPWKLVLDGTFTVRQLSVRRDRDRELYEAARKLKPQELSSIIQASTGLHIIKLENYSPERPLTFDEAKPLLVERLKGPYQEKRTREWEQELKKDAKIIVQDTSAQEQKKP